MIGSAWEQEAKGSGGRKYLQVSVSLGGLLPALHCRVVENPKRTKPRSPTHIALYSPRDGETVRIGAFWPHTNGNGVSYLIGYVETRAFGKVQHLGGGETDFRLAGEKVGVRISAVRERLSEKSPTHQLWRMRPVAKAAAASGTELVEDAMRAAATAEEIDAAIDQVDGDGNEVPDDFDGGDDGPTEDIQ